MRNRGVTMNRIDENDTQLGFVGVGAMGSRLVRRLLTHGYKVAVYDVHRANADALITDGATVSDSLAALASTADVILSCLTDDEAVRQVYFAADGIFAHAVPGTVVLEMSTIRPRTSREVADEGADRGMLVLGVAISGSTAVVAPAHVGKLPRAARNDYSPQFPLRLMNKDLRLIVETAAKLNLVLPVTEAAFETNSQALALGPDQDFSIVIRAMESRAEKKEQTTE